MNCQETQNLLTIAVYGRLTSSQREALQTHLQTCAECAALYEKTVPLMDLRIAEVSDIPEPDLERSWAVISNQVLRRRRALPQRILGTWARSPMRKWALAACSLLAVFALGYFAGKQVLGPGRSPLEPARAGMSASVESAAAYSSISFAEYADSLRPVLVSFLNRDGIETPEALRTLEQQLVSDMLARTRLLEGLAAGSGDDTLLELLQDMELILISLRNLDPEDRDSARHLAGLIREKRIRLRLQEFRSARSTF